MPADQRRDLLRAIATLLYYTQQEENWEEDILGAIFEGIRERLEEIRDDVDESADALEESFPTRAEELRERWEWVDDAINEVESLDLDFDQDLADQVSDAVSTIEGAMEISEPMPRRRRPALEDLIQVTSSTLPVRPLEAPPVSPPAPIALSPPLSREPLPTTTPRAARTFEIVRERLMQAGDDGLSPADLFRDVKGAGVPRRKGTYHSFRRQFWHLVQLGWVEATGEREPSLNPVLQDKALYRITDAGVYSEGWSNPYQSLYQYARDAEYWRRYYRSTGRPRGRPRGSGRRRQPAPVPVEREGAVFSDVVPAPVIGTGRRLRLSGRARIELALQELAPRVERLRTDSSDLEAVAVALLRILGTALDMAETAGPEEQNALEEIASRLDRARDGFDTMRRGLTNDNRRTYLAGWRVIKTCCP